jgi:hypothetical protein
MEMRMKSDETRRVMLCFIWTIADFAVEGWKLHQSYLALKPGEVLTYRWPELANDGEEEAQAAA